MARISERAKVYSIFRALPNGTRNTIQPQLFFIKISVSNTGEPFSIVINGNKCLIILSNSIYNNRRLGYKLQ